MSAPVPNTFADEFLDTVVDVARIGICIVNQAGVLVRVNPAFCELLGYAREEVTGQHFTIGAPPEIKARASEFLAAVLEESPRVRDEWRICHKDGRIIDALVSFKPLTVRTGDRFIVVTFTDISARKEAESALRESEERFRQLAENIHEVFWITDPEKQRMLYVSPAYETIWGRTAQSLYDDPMSFINAIHAEDRERIVAALALQSNGRYHEEYRIVRPDGAVRWVRDRAFPVRNADGRIYRIAGIATDITERRFTVEKFRQLNVELERRIAERTQELSAANALLRDEIEVRSRTAVELREVNERMRLLIDTANDAVVTIDDKSAIIDWNAAAEKTFGWSRQEAMGRPLTDLIVPPQHRSHHYAGLRRFLDGQGHGILNRRVETTGLRRNGSEFDIELSVWPVQADGRYTFSAFIRDISDRKAAELAVRQSEARYRAVVENAEEGIIVAQDGYLRFANPKAIALTGQPVDKVYNTPFLELIYEEDRARVFDNYVRRLKGEAVENQYNFRVRTPDGDLRWLQISAVMIEWAGKPATLNFLTDVTVRQQMEEELRRNLERERELSELKSNFVAMASHEFRTPLAEILSSAELIEDHGPRLKATEQREVLGIIKQAVKRMNEMIGQVLLLGRSEAGMLTFSPMPVDVDALCHLLVEESKRHTGRAAVSVEGGAGNALRLVDEKLLRHILANLLGNAAKYSPEASPVRLTIAAQTDQVVLTIIDQGIGISEQDQSLLFETFHRGANVGDVEGTGLGLAVVRQCVTLHGGTISVESQIGAGSSFTVSIKAPLAQ